jgi:hypothetical protein
MNTIVDCPIDFIPVNENKVRLTALWVLAIVAISIFAPSIILIAFLAIDFFLRAFNFGKYSPLNKLSEAAVKQFHVANKPIDQAPKRFAAKIGFMLSVVLAIFLLCGLLKAAFILQIVFAAFAFLESFLGFCAGCYVYSFLRRLKLIK